MSRTVAEITEEALALSKDEQLEIARVLLDHAEDAPEAGADDAWAEEISRRIELMDSGKMQARPFAEVLRDLDRKLSR